MEGLLREGERALQGVAGAEKEDCRRGEGTQRPIGTAVGGARDPEVDVGATTAEGAALPSASVGRGPDGERRPSISSASFAGSEG